jgi:hypothetical protein
MTNDAIAASLDDGVFSLARQTGDILAELRNLLQRAASALEADHLNQQERSHLIEELFAASIEEDEL